MNYGRRGFENLAFTGHIKDKKKEGNAASHVPDEHRRMVGGLRGEREWSKWTWLRAAKDGRLWRVMIDQNLKEYLCQTSCILLICITYFVID